MPFWRKLLLYLLGVVLGIFVVQFLFGWRDDIQCSYFPNDRVLYDMRQKKLIYTDEAKNQMQNLNLDTADINLLLHSGEVDFSKSKADIEDSCKLYLVELEAEEGEGFTANLLNCDSTLRVLELKR